MFLGCNDKRRFVGCRHSEDFTHADQQVLENLPHDGDLVRVAVNGVVDRKCSDNGQAAQEGANGKFMRNGQVDIALGKVRVQIRAHQKTENQDTQRIKVQHHGRVKEGRIAHRHSLHAEDSNHLRVGDVKWDGQGCNGNDCQQQLDAFDE